MNPGIDDRQAGTPSSELRILAAVIAIVVTALVCAIATWPRWHAATTPSPGALPTASSAPSSTPSSSSSAVPLAPSSSASVASVPAAPVTKVSPDASDTPGAAAASAPALAPPARVGASTRAVTGLLRLSPVSPSSPEAEAAVLWRNLSDLQRIALGPFASVWDKFSYRQKRKWLAIAAAYPDMPQDAQERLHARMLQWTQMSAEQRTIARENYEMSRVLAPSARQQAWRAYQALPPAQKQKLAEAERTHRRPLVVSAPPSARDLPRRHAIAPAPTSGARTTGAEHRGDNGQPNGQHEGQGNTQAGGQAPAVLGLRRNAVPQPTGTVGATGQPGKPAVATPESTQAAKPLGAPAADARQRSDSRPTDTGGDADGDAKP